MTAGRRSGGPGRASEILALLLGRYGPLEPPRVWDPLDELVLTILSQNTSDTNSGRAFESLRAAFGDWEAVAEAAVEDVVDAIRPGGLANTKAPRIQAVLREIASREGDAIDLGWMREAPDARVADYLGSLPGVGPKTVACVLAFSLGRDVIPVDTHVLRVATRLGLLPPKTTAEAAHRILAEEIPAGERVELHMAFIRLGRETCRARRPLCAECVLADLCPSAEI